jgi:hypothetical protein
MVIAHNLCYSTIAGKLRPGAGTTKDGTSLGENTTQRVGTITLTEDDTARVLALHDEPGKGPKQSYVAPNGSVFCHPTVRKGVLPSMLGEILGTRYVMVLIFSTILLLFFWVYLLISD